VSASQLLRSDKQIAIIERELIGRECAYWACIPSKTLLRQPEAKDRVDRTAGAERPRLDCPSTRDYRDYMVRNLHDSNQVAAYEKFGATVIKGIARSPGRARSTSTGGT
jgi:pyruvate/2-oxoglutarate dehydrogenase complex dihydrolipoamide dehydrogenase (E3) component